MADVHDQIRQELRKIARGRSMIKKADSMIQQAEQRIEQLADGLGTDAAAAPSPTIVVTSPLLPPQAELDQHYLDRAERRLTRLGYSSKYK